jgi:arylsulfatase A-like enzyme
MIATVRPATPEESPRQPAWGTFRATVWSVAISAGLLGGCSPKSAAPNAALKSTPAEPNVLLIVWDTVRADRLGCYGYGSPTTTHLDRFAASATLYENAVSPGMWTVPTHASLFTGLPVSTHGAVFGHKWLDDEFDTLAEIFRQAEYDTYCFSANPHVSDEDNLTQGFDRQDFAWTDPWVERIHQTMRPKLHPQDRSTDRFRRINDARPPGSAQIDIPRSESKDAGLVINDAFLSWVDDRASKKPFFAFLNYMEAHYPRLPSMDARRKLMTQDRIDQTLAIDQSSDRLIAYMFGLEALTPEELQAVNDVYDASLIDLDAITNDLFQKLTERGLLNDTIVVLTSDHGENLGDHGMMMHRYCLYNSLTRVPLLIRYPPHVPAARIARPISTADVFPTIIDLAGLEIAKNTGASTSLLGRDLSGPDDLPVISELVAPATRFMDRFVKRHANFNPAPWLRTYRSIEMTPYRFIWASDQRHELFDLRTDPNETKNLYAGLPERAAELQAKLNAWHESVEKYNPRSHAAPNRKTPTEESTERLKALGYVD